MTAGTALEARAYRLGSIDAYANRWMRDMDSSDSAWLMDALGLDGETTQANHAERVALCERYEEGYRDAASAIA